MTAVNITDNINNFTAAGKAAQKSDAEKAGTKLFDTTQDFIKMLTVQLQNQDPTKPLETDQITQQVASLSQVEQQINTNKNLESLIAFFTQSQNSNNVSYIGKYVEAPGNLSALQNGQATFVYDLAADAKTVEITVTDSAGNVVFNADGTKFAGRNTYLWNGKKSDGTQVPDGVYKLEVKARDDLDKVVTVTPSSFGKVSSVETIDGTSYLAMSDILVPLDKVISVRA